MKTAALTEYIRSCIECTLDRLHIFAPAVSTRQVVNHFGIPVYSHDIPGVDGWAGRHRGSPAIWVRSDLPRIERRFTIAHELGHIILRSRGIGSTFWRLADEAANLFALELLIPVFIWRLWQKLSVTELALRFQVSERLVTRRFLACSQILPEWA